VLGFTAGKRKTCMNQVSQYQRGSFQIAKIIICLTNCVICFCPLLKGSHWSVLPRASHFAPTQLCGEVNVFFHGGCAAVDILRTPKGRQHAYFLTGEMFVMAVRCNCNEMQHFHYLCCKIFCWIDFSRTLLRKGSYTFLFVNFVVMIARNGFIRCFILNHQEICNTVQDLSILTAFSAHCEEVMEFS
jgi:hypothetical protein